MARLLRGEMIMKILVSGGAGYIGTTLVPMLLDKGHDVTVFDILLWRGDVLIPFFRRSNFHFIKGDVRDEKAVFNACSGKDVVIHLAAIVGLPACAAQPEIAFQTNYEGSVNIGRACQNGQSEHRQGLSERTVCFVWLYGLQLRRSDQRGLHGRDSVEAPQSLWHYQDGRREISDGYDGMHGISLCYCIRSLASAASGPDGQRLHLHSDEAKVHDRL